MESSKTPRMCCYRCTRCQLDVYRHSVHYDRRDRPICDPDCDGSKPGTCIWCEQVIVGRPMLMFDKKVHRECWQYCVAKFGYDAIVRRYSCTDDVAKLREKEVGEDMVRELVEEFFDKFCYEILCDEEDGSSGEHDICERQREFKGKEGELEWGKAIQRVLRNKDNAALPDMTCANESKTNEDANQWRGLSEGESVDCDSGRRKGYYDELTLKEMLSESIDDKNKTLHRVHSSEEREKWLQAVRASLCGEKFFNRESWADTMFNNTMSEQVLEESCRSSNTTSFYEDQQIFVDRIIDEAVDVVKECNAESIYKTVGGKRVINHDTVWERATRTRNDTQNEWEFVDVRNVQGHTAQLVDGYIDKAVKGYLESSDEELENGVRENLLSSRELSDEDERIKRMFSKGWAEIRLFKEMYEKAAAKEESANYEGRCFEREDTGARQSSLTLNDDDEDICDYDGTPSQIAVRDDNIEGKKSSKRKKRRKKENDGNTSAEELSCVKLSSSNTNDLVFEPVRHEDTIDKKINLLPDSDRTTGIDHNGTERILTEEQLDDLFRNALVTSSDPGRLGCLINDFKNAVGDIQHNASNYQDCPHSHASPQSGYSVTEHFDSVLNQLMEHVTELSNSILIFRKYPRPEHLSDRSLGGDLVSTPQGEVYGTGNVLIIFDYGVECLESDPASVYEYLADIYQENESHQSNEAMYDFSGISSSNVHDYNEAGATGGASTFRDVNTYGASPILTTPQNSTNNDNITTYDEMFWAQVQSDRHNLNYLPESDRFTEVLFGTDSEEQAWAAMLKGGVNEETADEFATSVETIERLSSKDTHDMKNTNNNRECDNLFSPKIKRDDTCNRLKTSMLPQSERISCDITKKQTDTMLLDRLRSIKRINFDDNVTNLKGASESHNSYVVRKCVSESDVYSYEMCTCTRYPSCEDTSSGPADAECIWREERHIVTEEPSRHLHHSVSLGANKEPIDVYEIAIEITINKKTEEKCTKNRDLKCGRSTSIVDLMPFLREWTERKKTIMNESTSSIAKEQSVDCGLRLDLSTSNTYKHIGSEKTQSAPVQNTDGEHQDLRVTLRSKSVGETPLNNLSEDSSTNVLGNCNEIGAELGSLHEANHDSKRSGDTVLFERSVKELGDIGTRSEFNVSWMVSNDTLMTNVSKSDSSKNLSIREIDLKESGKELTLERTNERELEHRSSSQVGIDVDLFFDDPIRYLPKINTCHLVNARKPDGSIFDCTSVDDIFRTGFIENKRYLDTSKSLDERLVTSASDKKLVCLKEKNENFKYDTSSRKEFANHEEETGSYLPKKTNTPDIIDTQHSIDDGNYSYEHHITTLGLKYDEIGRHRSNKGNQIESLSGEEIKPKGSEKSQIEVEIHTSRNKTKGSNSIQENIECKLLNKAPKTSGQCNVAEEGIKVSSKSPETNAENADLRRRIKVSSSEHLTTKTLGHEIQCAQHFSDGRVTLQGSKTPNLDFKSVGEVTFLNKPIRKPDISLQASLQPDDNQLKEPDIVCDFFIENAIYIKPTTEQEQFPPISGQKDKELEKSQKSDGTLESSVTSSTKPLDIKRAISDSVTTGNKENVKDLDFDSVIEQEMVSLDLTEENGQLLVLMTDFNDTSARKSSPKRRKRSRGRFRYQEVDKDVLNPLSTVLNGSVIKGEFEIENYKGDSTDDEEEVGYVSEASEYGVDKEWPKESLSETFVAAFSRSMGDGVEQEATSEARSPPVRTGTRTLGREYGEDKDGDIEDALETTSSKIADIDKKGVKEKGKKGKKEKKEKKKDKKDKKKEGKDDGGRCKGSHTCVVL